MTTLSPKGIRQRASDRTFGRAAAIGYVQYMDDSFREQITPRVVAERMCALADHYHRVVAEARLPPSDSWLGDLATELEDIANLVRRDERDAYRQAIAWLHVLRRRAHDRGVLFLVMTLDNYCTVIGWLYDAASR